VKCQRPRGVSDREVSLRSKFQGFTRVILLRRLSRRLDTVLTWSPGPRTDAGFCVSGSQRTFSSLGLYPLRWYITRLYVSLDSCTVITGRAEPGAVARQSRSNVIGLTSQCDGCGTVREGRVRRAIASFPKTPFFPTNEKGNAQGFH